MKVFAIHEASGQDVTFQNDVAYAVVTGGASRDRDTHVCSSFGVVTKGNGEAWMTAETHMSLSAGGGQAGQGYPCVLVVYEERNDRSGL